MKLEQLHWNSYWQYSFTPQVSWCTLMWARLVTYVHSTMVANHFSRSKPGLSCQHGRELWWAILSITTRNLMTGCGAKSRSHMQLRLQMLEMVERLMFDLKVAKAVQLALRSTCSYSSVKAPWSRDSSTTHDGFQWIVSWWLLDHSDT
jgi:hypothetical protein